MSADPSVTTTNLCIVIPVYRHVQPLATHLAKIATHGFPVILVDDGNTEADSEVLRELAQQYQCTLLEHEQNQGKGSAVVSAAIEAQRCGYTHILQIDADGQHAVEDIETFAKASAQNPDVLILGAPRFDSSAPRSRVWGRKLTNALIVLQTWSTEVADGLFGYRVYPLAKFIELQKQERLQARMGFDIEILVRFLWSGVRVINIQSAVHYPKSGYSNFNYLSDNLSLICLHTKLLLYGVLRAPLGRWRASATPRENKWFEKPERGSVAAMKLLLGLYRIGGQPLLSFLLHPVILYFYLTDPTARRASRIYFERLVEFEPRLKTPRYFRSYFHLYSFGRKLITSLQAWAGEFRGKDVNWYGREMVFDMLDQGTGAFVLSAHIGCLEMCRATHRDRPGFTVIPLMYLRNAQKFMNTLRQLNPTSSFEVFAIEKVHAGVALEVQSRIRNGEFFAVLADRPAPGSPDRTIEVDFLGKKAHLPEGPFALAMALDCPVLIFFNAYNEKLKRYEGFWEEFTINRSAKRSERREELQRIAQEFARRMEQICVHAPMQWFNFFDYWEDK